MVVGGRRPGPGAYKNNRKFGKKCDSLSGAGTSRSRGTRIPAGSSLDGGEGKKEVVRNPTSCKVCLPELATTQRCTAQQ